jgi:uncharacterized protein YecE (DUF72 family)
MAPAVPIRVGTAGWAYEDWNSIVYPERPGRGFDRLGLMASLFDTNEINSTFYRIPAPRQTADWARRVEHNPRFAFTAKLYRGFTHEWKAGAAEEKAFGDAIEPLASAGRLGCVLAQFPFSFHNTAENRGRLEGLLARLPPFPTAVEFRHASWNAAQTRELLSRRGAAFVNIDQPDLAGNLLATDLVTAPLAYFRFHGRNARKWFGPDTSNEQRYNYLYSEDELAPWVERIRGVGLRAEALTNGDGTKGSIYAILNNHFRGQAVANAIELNAILTGAKPQIPSTLADAYPRLARIVPTRDSSGQRALFGSGFGGTR